MKHVLFLINAVSGRPSGKRIQERIVSELNGMLARDRYDTVFTDAMIVEQARKLSVHYETVVVAGGDGTIHQAVQGIAGLEPKPKMGIIPTGTGNDLARSLGIFSFFKSYGLRALLRLILQGKTTTIDLIGLGDKSLFTNYFGMGNDARISNRFNRIRFRPYFPNGTPVVFNKFLYAILGLTKGFYSIPFDVELTYKDGSSATHRLALPGGVYEIVVTNAKTYAGGDLLSSRCRMDDGKFEVTVVSDIRQWLMLHATRLFKKPLDVFCNRLIQFQTGELEIAFDGDTFYQIDGETLDGLPGEKKRLMVRVASNIDMIIP